MASRLGLFHDPDLARLLAVIFRNSGTLGKLNWMFLLPVGSLLV
jgi:hypothetical protein